MERQPQHASAPAASGALEESSAPCDRAAPTAKLPYEPPTARVLGSVRTLTLGTGGTLVDAGGQQQ